jgi:hypothetical protein
MASRDAYSSASSFTLRVTGPAVRWLVTRTVREAALVHGRWLRMTLTRVLPRLHFGLLGLRPGGFASNPNRKGGSVSTRPMASHDDHSSASSFTLRVTGPAARWQVTRTVREAASVHGRWLRVTPHSSASSFSLRVTGPATRWPNTVKSGHRCSCIS